MKKILKINPISKIKDTKNIALKYFVNRDLLNIKTNPKILWKLSEAQKILKHQLKDGAWKYPNPSFDRNIRTRTDYNQYQTYKMLRILVEVFAFDCTNQQIKKAFNYIFKSQTKEGDIRGIYANQYTPNYSAAIIELALIAGYKDKKKIKKFFDWIISIHQLDGGWAIPFRTQGKRLSVAFYTDKKIPTLKPIKEKPSSHLITGIVLRAFANHPKYKKSEIAKNAGEFLKSQIFKRDKYPDRVAKDYWLKFSYPYHWTDLISALDALYEIGFRKNDKDIQRGLNWFVKHQPKDGIWKAKVMNKQVADNDMWVTFAVARLFKKYYDIHS